VYTGGAVATLWRFTWTNEDYRLQCRNVASFFPHRQNVLLWSWYPFRYPAPRSLANQTLKRQRLRNNSRRGPAINSSWLINQHARMKEVTRNTSNLPYYSSRYLSTMTVLQLLSPTREPENRSLLWLILGHFFVLSVNRTLVFTRIITRSSRWFSSPSLSWTGLSPTLLIHSSANFLDGVA